MATFDYPYKKGVNVTAWVLQILVCVILLGTSAWLMSIISSDDYNDALGRYEGLFTAAAGLQIAITALTIVFDIIEIILITRKRMPPALYLTSACIKTTIWGVIFILNIISLTILSIVLTLVLFATSLMQLIYGAILVHRKRRGTLTGGNYTAAINPQGVPEAGYGAPQPGYYYPPQNVSTEYKPSTAVMPPAAQYPNVSPEIHGLQPPGSYELDSRQRFA
ncbi:hypothetical protein AAE478_009301 [Parahypoxylon ruwenzoriense]